jgi:hypothetical protein
MIATIELFLLPSFSVVDEVSPPAAMSAAVPFFMVIAQAFPALYPLSPKTLVIYSSLLSCRKESA